MINNAYIVSGVLAEIVKNEGSHQNVIFVRRSFGESENELREQFDAKIIKKLTSSTDTVNTVDTLESEVVLYVITSYSECKFGIVRTGQDRHTCLFKMTPCKKLFILCIQDSANYESDFLKLMIQGQYDNLLNGMV